MKRPAQLLLCLAALPLAAQSYGDSTLFGGSKVFSEGLDPQGDPARFDRLPAGIYLGWEGGDLKPWSAHEIARNFATAEKDGDAAAESRAIGDFYAKPWAQRLQSFGFQYVVQGGLRFGYSHGTLEGALADVDRSHLGVNLPLNTTSSTGRWYTTDQVFAGAGSKDGPNAVGFTARLARVDYGQETFYLNPQPGQAALTDLEQPLSAGPRNQRAWDFTLDAGYTRELSDRWRMGFTLDHLVPRSVGGIRQSAQLRAGLQYELTMGTQLSLESDLNAVERLPLPSKQRVTAAGLRVQANATTAFTFGIERRSGAELGARSLIVGAAVHIQTAPLLLSLGFRLGDDRDLMGAGFRIGS